MSVNTYCIFFFYLCSFMFELLSKLNISYSTKDQVLEVLEKCNSVLVGGKSFVFVFFFVFFFCFIVLVFGSTKIFSVRIRI